MRVTEGSLTPGNTFGVTDITQKPFSQITFATWCYSIGLIWTGPDSLGFGQSYELLLAVNNEYDHETFEVREREKDGRAHHSLQGRSLNLSCIFDTLTSEGYTVQGQ